MFDIEETPAHGADAPSSASRQMQKSRRPTGLRRVTPGSLKGDHTAAQFAGLPDGINSHCQLLAAFKEAAPCLGLPKDAVRAVDWFFKFTQPQDWQKGYVPIVFPSAETQQEALELSPTATKRLNRALIDAGLISMKDSPTGKRYGKRCNGHLVEPYGIDLSPLAVRYPEFLELARAAREERAERGRQRRQRTVLRKSITQMCDRAVGSGAVGGKWADWARESEAICRANRSAKLSAQVKQAVDKLAVMQLSVRDALESMLCDLPTIAPERTNLAPSGAESGPLQYTYKAALNPQEDTIEARPSTEIEINAAGVPRQTVSRGHLPECGRSLKVSLEDVLRIAPKLKALVQWEDPSMSEVVDAAGRLAQDYGVSQRLWGEACAFMGRGPAAVAIAIVSTKPDDHFQKSTAGYFHGMLTKARAGMLNLEPTVRSLLQNNRPAPPRAVPTDRSAIAPGFDDHPSRLAASAALDAKRREREPIVTLRKMMPIGKVVADVVARTRGGNPDRQPFR